MRKSFKYRIFPTHAQVTKLGATLDICRELYNASLQERRDAYRLERKSVRYVEQANQLPDIKKMTIIHLIKSAKRNGSALTM